MFLKRWRSRRVLIMSIMKTTKRHETSDASITDDIDDISKILLNRRCVKQWGYIMSSYVMGMVVRFVPYELPRAEEVMKALRLHR